VELFDKYDGAAPGIGGWALDKQNFEWVAPFHDGAIRYFQEIGVWTNQAQAHNDQLIARQAALAEAWAAFVAKDVSDEEWQAGWQEARQAALEAGGFDLVF
jgi:hypothetical protein